MLGLKQRIRYKFYPVIATVNIMAWQDKQFSNGLILPQVAHTNHVYLWIIISTVLLTAIVFLWYDENVKVTG